MPGSKVCKTRFRSARLIKPGAPLERQKPLKTSSSGLPDLLTALRTRPMTCCASGGAAFSCTAAPMPAPGICIGASRPMVTSSRSASRSDPCVICLKRSASSALLAPVLKDSKEVMNSSRLMRPRPIAALWRKKSNGVSFCASRRRRMFLISSACLDSPPPPSKPRCIQGPKLCCAFIVAPSRPSFCICAKSNDKR